ncbi:MAG: gamma-glutamyltransferase [Pirellulales bacterium]
MTSIALMTSLAPALRAASEATAERGMVVSVSPAASAVGVEILKTGGNAVDAAVATAFALAVTWPEAGNIGGGGFMMVAPPDAASPVCVEYRETAPAASTPTMYTLDESQFTHRMVGVPGTVAGLALAHERYGRLAWRELIAPAQRLAEQGVTVDAALAASLNEGLALVESSSEFARVFGKAGGKPDGEPWRAGDRLRQPDLAHTLRRLAVVGPEDFYTGQIARQIVAEMVRGDGLITATDLAEYRANVRPPVHVRFRSFDVYGPPLPSSGGICLAMLLGMLETFELGERDRWSADSVHVVIESLRRVFYQRARYLGDSDFVDVPAKLTAPEFAVQLARSIDPDHATPSEDLATDIEISDVTVAGEGAHTTHFSVADAEGWVVSNTYTLEQDFGSLIVVRGAGFLLNNEMGDFNRVPSHTDREGRIGTPANTIAPGKRMLSSQTPVIVYDDGQPRLALGSPGGRTIISTVLGVLLGTLEYDLPLRDAVDAPRLHHGWLPDEVHFEGVDDPEFSVLVDQLKQRGHRFADDTSPQGDVHAILIDPVSGALQGVADRRRRGSAVGW